MRDTNQELAAWLENGGSRIGQVVISRRGEGWELRHEADGGSSTLTEHRGANAARALANLDDQGVYRPLKTAPTPKLRPASCGSLFPLNRNAALRDITRR